MATKSAVTNNATTPGACFASPAQGGSVHQRCGCPYKLTNGNYGFFLPKKFFGSQTHGRKNLIDLKTNNVRLAQERIDAMGIMVQLLNPMIGSF